MIDRQLPDFVRADHPQFKLFLELYYAWMEDESKGNTVYHIMNAEGYRDIDETLDPFIRLFKQELLPYFPETTTLDLVKILKGAREFYVKKGSVESVKWLFRVLFGVEVEIYYPKQQILIASDGKWKLPQAFQLTLSATNLALDVNLLEKHKATGNVSKATCIIESANKTVDKTFGNEILEMYVSNVVRSFTNGEYLEIPYTDVNGVERVFSEKIIGSLSGIKVDSQIATDPQQKRRGLSYNVGDPVVVFGGLSTTPEANDAAAVVGNVTVGSIEGLSVVFPGYGYRIYSNTEAIVYRSVGDDPNANLSTDIRVAGITETVNTSNSNGTFAERIYVDKMPVSYLDAQLLNAADWALFTSNARNMSVTLNGTPGSGANKWYQYEDFYADSNGSYQTANITGKILTANTSWSGAPATVTLYAVANTNGRPLTLMTGNLITTVNSIRTYTVDAILDIAVAANINSQILQVLNFEAIDTGGVALYNIINGGYGFRADPTINTSSYFETYASEAYAYGTAEDKLWRQPIGIYGQIAHVYIDNPGTGYANGDTITIGGGGYGFTGTVNVNVANGTIISTTITNRGEGYYGNVDTRTVTVTSGGGGSNAVLSAYGFGEGLSTKVVTGAIGRVKDVRMLYRGFDYISTPLVSFKVMDMIINQILDAESFVEGERVYQGATLLTSTFSGIVKSYNRSTKLLRLFDYAGGYGDALSFTSEGGVVFTINDAAKVPAPSTYDANVIASGLNNPMFYGNGKAKGYAEFFNGLIKFTGFYLNTDGFLSSDKKMQDANVYHNYSYIIESEKSLIEYGSVMRDIVHPIGMSMLSRTISKANLESSITPNTKINLVGAIKVGTSVKVANTYRPVITGFGGTEFANTYYMSVGDMFLIQDTVAPLRSQAKTITVITNNTSLNTESNFIYIGQGRLTTNGTNTRVVISGNVNAVSDFLATGDTIRMNVNNTILAHAISGISGNVLTLNTAISTTNTNLVYQVVPDYNSVGYDYDIIRV